MTRTLNPSELLGRFEILKVLGKGAQGTVYLARDPHLQRQVAIKTLNVSSDGQAAELKTLLDEARIVSKFQHPNIVTVYDAGDQDGQPYLVFEYVEGTLLSDLLKKHGRLPVTRAVEIALQVLDGVAYAHRKQVVHRDLKPGNIMIDAEGTPRIMDFGIASNLSAEKAEQSTGIIGTPLYMAPEYVSKGEYDTRSDLFSIGMILYEMLAGVTAVRGSNVKEVLDRILHQNFEPPSSKNHEVTEQLDSIVLKTLAKNPQDRYESANALKTALNKFLNPEEEKGENLEAKSSQGTVEFLLRRMRHKSDFPTVSKTIADINKIVGSEQDGANQLSGVILKDFALTNKLLKLVNTAFYGQFGGTISTISRAVVILGFETIRNAAITLLLFDHLQNKAQASELKEEVIAVFFKGLIGREIGTKSGLREVEEAFICAMFHSLGKLLSMFYFYEESQEIDKLVEQGNSEENASIKVLGVSFEELGASIAKSWNFPGQIVGSMRQIKEERVKKPTNLTEQLRVVSGLASDLSYIAGNTEPAERAKELTELMARYGESIHLSEKFLTSVMEKSLADITAHASILNMNLPKSQFMGKVRKWTGHQEAAAPAGSGTDSEVMTVLGEGVANTLLKTSPVEMIGDEGESAKPRADAAAALAAGIQDITNSLVGDFKLNDLLRIILETMYRGMGFSRVLVCVRDPRDKKLHGRFGFGQDIDNVMKSFAIPISYTPDVFHVALSKGVDIMINDIDADNIKERVPAWYRKAVPARSFVLFPIIIDKAPIGLIYADQDKGTMSIEPKELNLLKTLRNQAVLAIKQKR